MTKRALIINSKAPYPLYTGGEMRTYQMIKLLSRIYDEVDIVYLTDRENSETRNGLIPYCKDIYSFTSSKYKYAFNALKGFLFGKLPLQVYYFYSPKMQKWIDANIHNYNIVFCNNIRTAEYVKNKPEIKKVIDFVDAISMNYDRAKNMVSGIWKYIYSIDHERCLLYELDILDKFDETIIISAIDGEYISSKSKNSNHKIAVISNMIEIPEKVKTDYNENEKSLVFVGSMFYESNITAVTYFVEEVFDKVKEKFPEIKFYIVGSRPDAKVIKLGEKPGVIVTGFVDDVSDYFVNPSIFVAPMLSGAGVQNKILQAMAAGCPVITSTIGAEGIENISKKELIVCDDAQTMADKIIFLLNNDDIRKSQAEHAKKYIVENLSEDIILTQLKQILKKI